MAGLTAALAAARHGAKVALMHDRPVLGGNASSECRVHICGADVHNHKPHLRETGILEEIRLDNLRRNPNRNFSVWDALLYEKCLLEPNITLLLNCSCLDASMKDGRIASVTGWQLTTQIMHTVNARIFIDCSGDSILAPLTGAACRMGREARGEFGESLAPEVADNKTMGLTCLFQAREYDTPQPYDPPSWIRRFDSCESIPYGRGGHSFWEMGYWWVELGGEDDAIGDTEVLRDRLLATTLGLWDHIKNRCEQSGRAANWALEWLQFLPAKRESRRYEGAHILTQNDIRAGGKFDDVVAYGGWSMDDHHPAGFEAVRVNAPATHFHETPFCYGIPYRCLYSRTVPNLMCAGRNASCTHMAMSSTRVMGTGCSMGQAAGTAASLAISNGKDPAGVGPMVGMLQQSLLYDDCYLPGITQKMSSLTRESALTCSEGNPEPVRDGVNRQTGDDTHCWMSGPGGWVEYRLKRPGRVEHATLVLDSAMERNIAMSWHQRDNQLRQVPDVAAKAFRIDCESDGRAETVARMTDNHQRLVRITIGRDVGSVKFILDQTWGARSSRIYAFYLD